MFMLNNTLFNKDESLLKINYCVPDAQKSPKGMGNIL